MQFRFTSTHLNFRWNLKCASTTNFKFSSELAVSTNYNNSSEKIIIKHNIIKNASNHRNRIIQSW